MVGDLPVLSGKRDESVTSLLQDDMAIADKDNRGAFEQAGSAHLSWAAHY